MDATLEFTAQLACKAGSLGKDFFLRNRAHAGLQMGIKADHSLVTEADLAVDHLITSAIRRQYPSDNILSEELQPTYSQPSLSSAGIWIVDPIDGTSNFALGLHVWGVLITRLQDGYPHTTAMYFPMMDELFIAQRGQGAYLNNIPIHPQPPDPALSVAFFSCCARTFRRYEVSLPYKARILGSSGYTMCLVASGRVVLGFDATAKIWDLAGGWLLVEEAGGRVTTLHDHQPFPIQPGIPYAKHGFPVITAANNELIEQSRQQLVLRKPSPASPQ